MMSKKKTFVCFCLFMILFSFIFHTDQSYKVQAATQDSMVITFSEKTYSSQQKTVTINNLVSVDNISVDDGNVSYSVSGDLVTINVSGGSYHDSYTPSKTGYETEGPQESTYFSSTEYYNDGTYSGYLDKDGSYYVDGEDYDSKTVYETEGPQSSDSFPSSIYYSSGGYSGYLYQDGSSDESIADSWEDSKYIDDGWEYDSGYCGNGGAPCSWQTKCGWSGMCGSYSYTDSEGYSGTIDEDYDYDSTAVYDENGVQEGFNWDREAHYSGYIYKTFYEYEYTQDYSGTVRDYYDLYSQDYSGTVYADTEYYYDYVVTLDYSYNRLPSVNISDNAPSTIYRGDTFQVFANPSDPDGSITNYSWSGAVSGSGSNVTSRTFTPTTMGNHTINVVVTDNDGGTATDSRTFPVLNKVPSATVTSPSGSLSSPARTRASSVTVNWNYYDGDGDPQTRYRVRIWNQSTGALFKDSGVVSSSNTSWTTTSFPYNTLFRIQISVYDGYNWGGSSYSYFRTNARSVSNVTAPSSTSSSNPTRMSVTPTIKWNHTDVNSDPQSRYQLLIYRTSDNALIKSYGPVTSTAKSRFVASGVLQKHTNYYARVRIFDGYDWSAYSSRKYFLTNRLPSAAITFPSGTNASNATGAQVPFTMTWNYSDPDSHAQNRYQVRIYKASTNALVHDTGYVSSSTKSYNVSTSIGLATGETYYARVRVYDGGEWSSFSPARYFITNRPPTAGFNRSPITIYEGDTVQITSTATDPDGDTLTYLYTLEKPDGTTSTYTAANPSFRLVQVGTYTLTQRVTDPYGEIDSITKTFNVAQLIITGQVGHTADWIQIHDTNGNATNEYYSGEKFLLRADVTDHTIDYVRVDFEGEQVDGNTLSLSTNLSPVTNAIWTGSLYDQAMTEPATRLENGTVTFTFTIRYSNGTVKTDTVNVQIIGSAYEALNFHRSN